MGREVKRVPPTFDWPLRKVWEGFLSPDRFDEVPCEACCYDRPPSVMDRLFGSPSRSGTGYTAHAQNLHDQWYGKAPFDLASTAKRSSRSIVPPDSMKAGRYARVLQHAACLRSRPSLPHTYGEAISMPEAAAPVVFQGRGP